MLVKISIPIMIIAMMIIITTSPNNTATVSFMEYNIGIWVDIAITILKYLPYPNREKNVLGKNWDTIERWRVYMYKCTVYLETTWVMGQWYSTPNVHKHVTGSNLRWGWFCKQLACRLSRDMSMYNCGNDIGKAWRYYQNLRSHVKTPLQ